MYRAAECTLSTPFRHSKPSRKRTFSGAQFSPGCLDISKRYQLNYDTGKLSSAQRFWPLTICRIDELHFEEDNTLRYIMGYRTEGLHYNEDRSGR